MIKSTISRVFAGLLLVPVFAFAGAVATPATTYAADVECDTSAENLTLDAGTKCAKGNSQGANLMGVFRTVVNILLFLVGAVAVIMLVIGGLRYVTSNGDQNAVTGAKNTIMYAIIGIVVAFLAYAAVGFVTSQLQAGTADDEAIDAGAVIIRPRA